MVLDGNEIRVKKGEKDGPIPGGRDYEFGRTFPHPGTNGRGVFFAHSSKATKAAIREHLSANGVKQDSIEFLLLPHPGTSSVALFTSTADAVKAIQRLDKTKLLEEAFRATVSWEDALITEPDWPPLSTQKTKVK
eukprot:Filipodium_phascolosomae@DN2378_c0_g1_i1.p1